MKYRGKITRICFQIKNKFLNKQYDLPLFQKKILSIFVFQRWQTKNHYLAGIQIKTKLRYFIKLAYNGTYIMAVYQPNAALRSFK
jgi:hypothetical protein